MVHRSTTNGATLGFEQTLWLAADTVLEMPRWHFKPVGRETVSSLSKSCAHSSNCASSLPLMRISQGSLMNLRSDMTASSGLCSMQSGS